MKPNSLFLVSLSFGVLLGGSGCQLFGKSKKSKENPAIAAGVEADFRQRWVDQRTAALVNQGTEAAAARAQADSEFRVKYAFLKEEKK